MARLFTATTSDVLQFSMVPKAEAEVWGPMTAVAVVKRSSDGGASSTILSTNTTTARCGFFGIDGTPNTIIYYSGVALSTGPTLLTADGWALAAVSRPAGTTAGRAHKFIYKTGVWTQAAATGTFANAAVAGAGGSWRIGGATGSVGWMRGDVAAVAYVPRVLTDSEVRRLVGGNWQRLIPDALIHVEFPPEDNPTVGVRDSSRWRQRQVARTGTTRSAVVGPPGFRYSPTALRR